MQATAFIQSRAIRGLTSLRVWLASGLMLACGVRALPAQSPPHLSITHPAAGSWIRMSVTNPVPGAYHLEGAFDLSNWTEIGLTLDGLVEYPDPASGVVPRRFYRVWLADKTPANDWKNQIHFPADPFRSGEAGQIPNDIQWVKFAILTSEPDRVYYQDSGKYLFHYDFAVARLDPLRGLNPAEFDQVSLRTNGQQVILGTVLFPPAPNEAEYGIQLVGLDPYPVEQVAWAFERVRATVVAADGVRAFYLPTYEQAANAELHRAELAAMGIELGSTGRWLAGDQCYATGWAVGRLQFIAAGEITAAYTDGRLQSGDILLTDGVPAEIPFLAGVISLEPATPNSHVAILARSYGIPFVHLAREEDRSRALGLAGRRVAFRAVRGFELCEVRLMDLENELTPELEAEILQLKRPPELNIPAKARRGAYSASVDSLTPADIIYFGGKASNYGFLRRAIPDHATPAVAFSFDLWDDFLDQTLPGGVTLREAIADRLAAHAYPPDVAALQGDLADIREMITVTAAFPGPLMDAVTNALVSFDASRKIRFRSSTNVEDTEQFVGAGLYDSYSGCLLDDLDGDTTGPSLCDPEEANERGVFRAIKKVYASFYNDNAYLERLRHGLDESKVGMAVLVHHSFPDEMEWGNGVATLEVNHWGGTQQMSGELVTQDGAVPVTNPEGGALPEVVSAYRYGTSTYLNLVQRSSLVPLGDYVLDWDADYRAFMGLFSSVATVYRAYYPAKTTFLLDFEYKKMEPGRLEVKQVRELPRPDTVTQIDPFLLHESNRFCVFQGEAADVFSNHRLKSQWSFVTRNLRLTETNLAQSIYRSASLEFLEGGQIRTESGDPAMWDNAQYQRSGNHLTNAWTFGSGKDQLQFRLYTELIRPVSVSANVLFTLSDFNLYWMVTYPSPQPALDYQGQAILVTNELVRLVPCPGADAASLRQVRRMTNNGVVVETVFYWPEEPTGVVAGYTAPLVAWEQTTLTGLTTEPIVLHGDYAQTYRPGHHNFTEEFIFEPALEPGLDPAVRAELESKDIRLLHAVAGLIGDPMQILGFDGRFRPVP